MSELTVINLVSEAETGQNGLQIMPCSFCGVYHEYDIRFSLRKVWMVGIRFYYSTLLLGRSATEGEEIIVKASPHSRSLYLFAMGVKEKKLALSH